MASILYHYCSAEAFFSIVTNRSIWLSSLGQSNDLLEGRLVSASIARLAEADRMDSQSAKRIADAIANVENSTDALGFCLSGHGDLLSQWRGYAADGSGFSIGLDIRTLESLCEGASSEDGPGFHLGRVQYATVDQDQLVRPIYERFRTLVASSAMRVSADSKDPASTFRAEFLSEVRNYSDLLQAQLEVVPMLHQLKSPAFAEEQEWRLLLPYLRPQRHGLQYRLSRGQVLPYKAVPLPVESQSIVKIYLGPKNSTPLSVIQSFVESHGFSPVVVEMSLATYR